MQVQINLEKAHRLQNLPPTYLEYRLRVTQFILSTFWDKRVNISKISDRSRTFGSALSHHLVRTDHQEEFVLMTEELAMVNGRIVLYCVYRYMYKYRIAWLREVC